MSAMDRQAQRLRDHMEANGWRWDDPDERALYILGLRLGFTLDEIDELGLRQKLNDAAMARMRQTLKEIIPLLDRANPIMAIGLLIELADTPAERILDGLQDEYRSAVEGWLDGMPVETLADLDVISMEEALAYLERDGQFGDALCLWAANQEMKEAKVIER